MELTGINISTISKGELIYKEGSLRADRRAGRYIERPCFAPYYGALEKRSSANAPTSVERNDYK